MSRLKVNKNRIMAFVSALVVSVSFLCGGVVAEASEMDETFDEHAVVYDVNGDGTITLDEVKDKTLPIRALFNLIGACYGKPVSAISLADKIAESQAYQDFLAKNEPAELVVGYLTDDNFFYFSDGVIGVAKNFIEEEKKNNGICRTVGAISKEQLNSWALQNHTNGILSDYGYESFYNWYIALTNESYTGSLVYYNPDNQYFGFYVSVGKAGYGVAKYYSSELSYVQYSSSEYSLYSSYKTSLMSCDSSFNSPWGKFLVEYSDSYEYYGLNMSFPIFESLADWMKYKGGSSTVYTSSDSADSSDNVAIKIDTLNQANWEEINNGIYNTVVNNITNMENPKVNDVQGITDEQFAKLQESLDILEEGSFESNATLDEILAQLTADGERQSSWLKKIYDLLVEWFPKLGSGGDTNIDVDVNVTPEEEEEENNKIDDFETNSDSQSSTLDELNEQNKVDKIDVDGASSSVDSHIDMESVGQYGTLLTSVTSHEKVLAMLLGSLSISLIAYVLFGKR